MMRIDHTLCDICGTCAGVCPGDAISVGRDEVNIDPEVCTQCGQCESVCPSGAIRLE